MTKKEELIETLARAKKAEKWQSRLKKLNNRAKEPMTEVDFCRKYGIDPAQFNRNKNGKTIPKKDSLDKVEAAFKAEGV